MLHAWFVHLLGFGATVIGDRPTADAHPGPPPAQLETRALFERLERDRDGVTRDALVERFLPLARRMARRIGYGDDVEDLDQIAVIGLMKAIDRFDVHRGTKFISYAAPMIVGELKRHLRDQGWSVHVPRGVQELALRVERVASHMVAELGRAPTVAEIAVRVDASIERVLEALQAGNARYASSLDQPRQLTDDGDDVGREVPVVDRGYAAVEDSDQLEGLMQILTDRDRRILHLRFGEDHRQSQIAKLNGLSQMQVSRIIQKSIGKLQLAAAALESAKAAETSESTSATHRHR